MFDEAFMLILRSISTTQVKGADLNNDSMMLIKALGKVGCKYSRYHFPLLTFFFPLCTHSFHSELDI